MRLDRCRDDVRAELELIAQELTQSELLLRKVRLSPPDHVEIRAVAALVHSFYTGVENIFKRIVSNIDEIKLTSIGWHRELLDLMARAVPQRPAVISPALHATLKQYLGFRHFYRNSYTFQFDWELMRGSVEKLGDVSSRFRDEINAFLTAMEARPR